MPRFYTYLYRVNGTPEYVGKGQDDRFIAHILDKSNHSGKFWRRHLRSQIAKGSDVRCEIVLITQDEQEALDHEVRLISLYGRRDLGTGTLYNLTDGGEGVRGAVITEETRARLREASLGENNPFFGRQHSADSLDLQSDAKVGAKNPFHSSKGRKNPAQGKPAHNRVLSDDVVRYIREQISLNRSVLSVKNKLGCSYNAVAGVACGRTYQEVR